MNAAQLLPWVAVILFAIGLIYHSGRLTTVLERLADKSDEHDDRIAAHGEKIAGHSHDLAWIKRNMGDR